MTNWIRVVLITMGLLLLHTTAAAQLTGTFEVGVGGNYETLKEAFDDLMDKGNSGDVTLLITSDLTETENVFLGINPEPHTITVKPAEATTPVVTFTSETSNSNINGALVIGATGDDNDLLTETRNIIIDGSNTEGGSTRDLTLRTSSDANTSNYFRIAGSVIDSKIINTNLETEQLSFDVLFISAMEPGEEALFPQNLEISNNFIKSNPSRSSSRAINIWGQFSPSIGARNTIIKDNDIEARRYGVWLREEAESTTIENNTIQVTETGTATAFGILISDVVNSSDEIVIRNNTIHDSEAQGNDFLAVSAESPAVYEITGNTFENLSAAETLFGINIDAGGEYEISGNRFNDFTGDGGVEMISFANNIVGDHTATISNNFMTGFASGGSDGEFLYGIVVRSPNGSDTVDVKLYHNTIRMNPISISGTGWNYRGLSLFSNARISVELRNNILINDDDNGTAVTSFAYFQGGSAAADFDSDFNLWHGANLSAGDDTYLSSHAGDAATTLSEHQTNTGEDANSVSKSLEFVDVAAGNLRLTGASDGDSDLAGTPLEEVTTDIDGQDRDPFRPYMGAWEGQKLSPTVEIAGNAGWRMMSAPTDNFKVSDLESQTGIQGIEGGEYGTEFDPNIFTSYDGTDWGIPSNVDHTLEAGNGFILFFFDNDDFGSSELPVTLSAPGNTIDTDVTVNLRSDGDNWNLAGNPFDASLDVSDIVNWANGGSLLSNTVQVWDNAEETYVDLNDNGSVAAGWQGFFIHNDGATSLTIPESARTTGGEFRKQQDELIRRVAFELTGDIDGRDKPVTDRAISIVFHEEAGDGWDIWDAAKLRPLSSEFAVLSFKGSLEGEEIFKSRESRELNPEDPFEIPLYISSNNVQGEFTLSWPVMDEIPSDWEITLVDLETGSEIDLQNNEFYIFSFDDENHDSNANRAGIEDGTQRFILSVDAGLVTSLENDGIPGQVSLKQNYPNPFNPVTTIGFQLPQTSDVTLEVFDMIGRRVATLVNETVEAGTHEVTFDASNLSSGVYVYRLQTEGMTLSRKLTLIK